MAHGRLTLSAPNEETPMSAKEKPTKQLGALVRELAEAAKVQVERCV